MRSHRRIITIHIRWISLIPSIKTTPITISTHHPKPSLSLLHRRILITIIRPRAIQLQRVRIYMDNSNCYINHLINTQIITQIIMQISLDISNRHRFMAIAASAAVVRMEYPTFSPIFATPRIMDRWGRFRKSGDSLVRRLMTSTQMMICNACQRFFAKWCEVQGDPISCRRLWTFQDSRRKDFRIIVYWS